jgi:hypothetical protein
MAQERRKNLTKDGMMEPHLTEEFGETFWWRTRAEEKNLKPINALCFWYDITGFGKALSDCNWKLEKLQETGLIKLLSDVYTFAASPRCVQFPPQSSEHVLAINDGIAKTIDVLGVDSYADPRLLMYYLRDNLCVHYSLVNTARVAGYGFRSVFAGGERIQYAPVKITGQSLLHYNPACITEPTVNFLKQELVYYPAEFQMNTAFSRAFIIESKGSKFGINKDRLYIEEGFFEVLKIALGNYIQIIDNRTDKIEFFHQDSLLFDISYDKIIDFKSENLTCKVFQLSAFVVHKALEGETTEFPLLPELIEEILNKRWAITKDGLKEIK